MKYVEPWHSSKIPDSSILYKLFLKGSEVKCFDPIDEKVNTKSCVSDSGSYFSVLTMTDSKDKIDTITLYIEDENATKDEVTEFLEVAVSEKAARNLSRIAFLNVQSKYTESVLREFADKVSRSHVHTGEGLNTYIFYMPPSQLTCEDTDLPEGYSFGSLGECNLKYLAAQWASDLGSSTPHLLEATIKLNYSNRPYVAVYHSKEAHPIAWIVTYASGLVGSLHVREDHRGKGLARFVVRKIYGLVKDLYGLPPPVLIEVRNVASDALFQSEGWVREAVSYSTMFTQATYLAN